MKFHITRAEVLCVIDQVYTQDDYTRGVGHHKTNYTISNNHPDHQQAFWQTALVMESAARQRVGIFDPIHLPELMEYLGNE